MGRRRIGPAEVVVKPRRTTTLVSPRLDHYAWRKLKRDHKAHSKIHQSPCWLNEYGLCLYHGAPIDYDAKPGTRRAYETDHKQTRHARPDLWLVWANLGASHVACNRSRQNKTVTPNDVVPQANWVRPTF
jgi:hypothetical protein